MKSKYLITALLLAWSAALAFGQQTIIRGKVTDAETGDPVPFANVLIQGSNVGTPTDFDGNYEIIGEAASDTVIFSYIGYETRRKVYERGIAQVINVQLNPEATSLADFVITSGRAENPAFAIMRAVIDNKNKNDKRRIDAYEFDSYNKIEIDIDNINDEFREKKYMKKVTSVLDSIDQIAGEDGKPILPIFISESLSKFYFRSNPRLQKEQIIKTKITGIGIEDGSLISQVIGSSFQEYNFYQNRMNIVDKEFASPIGDGWRLVYNYELKDSVYIDNEFCYILDFEPKNDQELAFKGTMWVAKEDYGVKRIDATMQATANLNFIDKIKIQQELQRMDNGAWIPNKSRVLIDVAEITKKSAGFLAKFYTSNKNITLTEAKPNRFFERTIELEEDARISDEDFWIANRHDSLSRTEINVIAMIDSLKQIPIVKTWTNLLKTFARGYVEVGQFDLGPWPFLASFNNIEGFRTRLGGRTNEHFSLKWQFNGYLAYGFDDKKFKYGLGVTHIISRKKWTTVSLNYQKDIDQLGLQSGGITDIDNANAFVALTQLGNLIRPFAYERYQLDFTSQISRPFSFSFRFKNQDFTPLFDGFSYYTVQGSTDSPTDTNFTNTEFTLKLKYAKDENFIISDNSRISLGTFRWPIFVLAYTRGIKGPFGGDFNFNKLDVGISQRVKLGIFGVSFYEITASKVFDEIPYPLLTGHIGNEQPVFASFAFNTMNFYEFVSQSYASFKYQHFFEGFILNRVPLLKKLKWRLVASGNLLYGQVSDATLANQPTVDFLTLDGNKPFSEVGIGVENIFKVFRVDFFQRLSYLNNPDVTQRQIKVSFNLSL
ncbi:MAG: hypothetical protein ACJAS3_000751 [Roseivirga sp.]